MNLFELFVKIGVDDQASNNLSKITDKLGNGLKTAAKIGTAAVTAAAAGITALTTAAVNNYAEYEQLVGGVDTLFKDASEKVQQYAADAYKTAGMSANDYMANATAFSASLISSLGGDTEKAAEYANRAMVSMSDNANRMGTSLDSIVQTYQSLSRGNMAMLDNLKLGYGGTKAELERLIADAASYTDIQKKMGITVDASSMSFDNIVNAIAVVQEKLGIAGATAAEAGTTIEGSVNSMKSAWQNLITGLADGNADIGKLVDNLVTTIVGDGTESNLGVLGNIMPAVKRALNGASTLVQEILPIIVQEIPTIINENLPVLTKAAVSIVQALVDGISENQEMLTTTAFEIITFLSTSLISMLPKILQLGLDLIISLASGITRYLPELSESLMDLVEYIVSVLTDEQTLDDLLDAAIAIIIALTDLLIESLPKLAEASNAIIIKLVEFLTDPETLTKLGEAAIQIVVELGSALGESAFKLSTPAGLLSNVIIQSIKKSEWGQTGKDIVASIWEGIKEMWEKLSHWFDEKIDGIVGGFEDAVNTIKRLLGISTDDNSISNKNVGGGSFGTSQAQIGASGGMVGNAAMGGVTVNQYIYAQPQSAADLAQETQWEAERGVLQAVAVGGR